MSDQQGNMNLMVMAQAVQVLASKYEDLERRVTEMEERLDGLSDGRGRKPRPIVQSEVGVCGLDPDSEDSAQCLSANVYRYQQGCRGTGCVMANSQYYADYRARRREKS